MIISEEENEPYRLRLDRSCSWIYHVYANFSYYRSISGMKKHDIVYFVKATSKNEELRYSLRSVEKNWPYFRVWFCGGCPDDITPDKMMKLKQQGLNKWEKVRNSIIAVCKNDEITEDFWLFNDDFFVMKKRKKDFEPQYNGLIADYIERIKKKYHGSHSEYTIRLLKTIETLEKANYESLNYEVHKPMLINRKKALEVLEKFPGVGGFRSLYGNYWQVGGENQHDMKIKELGVFDWEDWEFLSTADKSFREGEVGKYIRGKFNKISRFEEAE